jgi:hypothetical protein
MILGSRQLPAHEVPLHSDISRSPVDVVSLQGQQLAGAHSGAEAAEHQWIPVWESIATSEAPGARKYLPKTQRRICRQPLVLHKWKRRFDELGAAGLYDRPRTPHRSPRAAARGVVSKILYLRQHYHFGPGMIADYLKPFHQVSIAPSSVHRCWGSTG